MPTAFVKADFLATLYVIRVGVAQRAADRVSPDHLQGSSRQRSSGILRAIDILQQLLRLKPQRDFDEPPQHVPGATEVARLIHLRPVSN